ncbi:YhfH family protein [Bacillus sp. M6-12]|nr:protein YhfH [Bacillus sp. M6-12]PLS18284.1 YhfH family protein [Bacillus sp. M6-12]
MKKSNEFKMQTQKQCPECGEKFHEHHESFLMECDRCLSKREE